MTSYLVKKVPIEKESIYALDTKEQSVRAINYSLSAWKFLPDEIFSDVRKGHKTKPE